MFYGVDLFNQTYHPQKYATYIINYKVNSILHLFRASCWKVVSQSLW